MRNARRIAVLHAGADIAGQIGIDAHAAQVEGVAQVKFQVDIQGQRRRFLAAPGFLAQHHHVAASRRGILRRQFDQRAVLNDRERGLKLAGRLEDDVAADRIQASLFFSRSSGLALDLKVFTKRSIRS